MPSHPQRPHQACTNGEVGVLRELTRRYLDVCAKPVQQTRRELWRRKNALEPTPPLIYARAFAWAEMPDSQCRCEDPFFRHYENQLRHDMFWDTLDDDAVFEPWLTVTATYTCTGWGVEATRRHSDQPRGSWKADYPLKSLDDIERLRPPFHAIDEARTARDAARLADAVGDLIPINVDRRPYYYHWHADLSTDLGYLRGIENFMLDMMENPAGLHRLMAFMRDGVLRAQQQAEDAGDWGLCDHANQAMPYVHGLRDPAANVTGVSRGELWNFTASQETTLVGPDMFGEFMLDYQRPIMEHFALSAYGCCEDLTRKIDTLRRVRNLRRIAVAPAADVARCAEQIGTDYVVSYRPSPTDMVGYGFDPYRIRRIVTADLDACRGCDVDITLKDVETVQRDPTRVARWVRIVREIIDDLTG